MEAYQELEQAFGQWAEVNNVVACNSGTAALHLALEALRLPAGSEVLIPDYTMVACARAVVLAGLKPVLIDCDPARLCLNPALITQAITSKTAAVMAVHVYGRRCPMDLIASAARVGGLALVEDLAEAHGVPVHPDTDAASRSFYRNKIVAGEEGGAVAFKEPKAAEYARCLRSVGFTAKHDYTHIPRGHNYRLANALATIILKRLQVIQSGPLMPASGNPLLAGQTWMEMRRYIESMYDARCPAEWKQPYRDAPWVYDLRIKQLCPSLQQSAVTQLQAKGIAARFGFKPMSWQPEFVNCRYVKNSGESERAANEVIYLPIDPATFDDKMCCEVFEVLKSVTGRPDSGIYKKPVCSVK